MTEQERNARVAELVCSGKTLTDVAKEVGLTQPRVSQLMAKFRAEWKAKEEIAASDHIQIELAKLFKTYQQADEAYQKSLEDGVKVMTVKSMRKESKDDDGPAKLKVTGETKIVESKIGDPAHLNVKLKCIEMALKLLNAFPKEETNNNVTIQQFDFSQFANPIPCEIPIDVTPSSEVERRIQDELGNSSKQDKSPSPNGSDGNGKPHD